MLGEHNRKLRQQEYWVVGQSEKIAVARERKARYRTFVASASSLRHEGCAALQACQEQYSDGHCDDGGL